MEKNGTVKNGRVAAKIKRKVKSSKMTNCRKIKQLGCCWGVGNFLVQACAKFFEDIHATYAPVALIISTCKPRRCESCSSNVWCTLNSWCFKFLFKIMKHPLSPHFAIILVIYESIIVH